MQNKISLFIYTVTLFSFLFPLNGNGQELNITVTVSAPNVMIADPKIFEALEEELESFYNTTVWTDDSFEEHERIEGNIQLTVKEELSATSFKGELIVQTSRPVYNSTYRTPTLNYIDKNIAFTYDGVRPIQKTESNYLDNFSSILSFYAYFILGTDYDSFSEMGGSQYFDKAFEIYNALPSSVQLGDNGWTINDSKQQNRYFLMENVRSPQMKKYRQAFYQYHRHGLDKMYDNFEGARATMVDALTDIGRANKEANDAFLPKLFSDTKRTEIVEVFKPATPTNKTKVRSIMISIDPAQSSAYKDLR